jgi:CHASE3 domain sensor protein
MRISALKSLRLPGSASTASLSRKAGFSLAIGKRLLGGFGLGLFAFVVLSVVSYKSAGQLADTTDWVRHTHEVLAKLQQVNSDIIGIQAAVRGFAITGPVDYPAAYHEALRRQRDDEQALRQLTADNPRQQARLTALEELIRRQAAFSEKTLGLRPSQPSAAAELISTGPGTEITKNLGSAIVALEREEQDLLTRRQAQTHVLATRTFFILSGGPIVVLGLFLIVLFFLNAEAAERR